MDQEKKGYLLIVLSGMIWGTIGMFVKQMQYYGGQASVIALIRLGFAFVILLAITVLRFGVGALKVSKKNLLIFLLLGLICQAFLNVMNTICVMLSGVAIAAVLYELSPVCALICSYFLFGEKITGFKVFAIVVNMVGCVLAATNGELSLANLSVTGLFCGAMAGIAYGLTPVIGRLATENSNPYVASTYNFLFGALFLGLFNLPQLGHVTINSHILLWGFFYALFPTALVYILYYSGLQMVKETSRVPVLASAEPVVAVILGMALYGEQIKLLGFVGIGMVLTSIVLMNKK